MEVADVGPDSDWRNSLRWMQSEESDFPVKTAAEIVLGSEGRSEAKKETIVIDVIDGQDCDSSFYGYMYMAGQIVPTEVGSRYKYSNYLIDPNRFRFRRVVRVLGLVFLFIKKFISKNEGNTKRYAI